MNSEEKLKEVKSKAQVFLDKQTFVFIKAVKSNGGFELHNGYITEISANFFMLKDYKTNSQIPIFFLEIINEGSIFEPSRVKEGGKENDI